MKYVKTTSGLMPLDDYLEIRAMQQGFNSYEELNEEGYSIEIPESDIIEKEEKYAVRRYGRNLKLF